MSLTRTAMSGAVWTLASSSGRRLTMLVTGIVLARLLAPADFGLVAMALMFISFVELIRDLGTGAGIIQAEDPSDRLLSSVFWLNLLFGVAATALLLLVASPAAQLLREERLVPVLRMLAISPLLSSFNVVQSNLLLRQLEFRRLAMTELAGAVVGGIVGIALAARGHGVWSLVWQSLSGSLALSAGVWGASRWRPRLAFDRPGVAKLLAFSTNLTLYNVLNFVARNADNFLIGRYLGAQSLGYYDLAYRVMLSSLQLVSGTFTRSLFPVYARMQGDHRRFGSAYLKVMALTALVADPAIGEAHFDEHACKGHLDGHRRRVLGAYEARLRAMGVGA